MKDIDSWETMVVELLVIIIVGSIGMSLTYGLMLLFITFWKFFLFLAFAIFVGAIIVEAIRS